MIIRFLFALFLISFSSLSTTAQKISQFSKDNAIKLINLLEIAPSSEMTIYIVLERNLGDEAFLLEVVQSKLEIEVNDSYYFKHDGLDVYVVDYSNTNSAKNPRTHGLFFETDAQFWKILALLSDSQSPQYFILNLLSNDSSNISDSSTVWDIEN
jgi:endo-alpha-1,4-polygalactosaminidase (GH114 family)